MNLPEMMVKTVSVCFICLLVKEVAVGSYHDEFHFCVQACY